MPALAYPSSLPGPMPGNFTPRQRRRVSPIDGPPQQRAHQRDGAGLQSEYTYVYTPAEMAVWRAWYRDTLLQGRRWFAHNLPGRAGMVPRVVRYRDVQQQLLGAGIYRVSAGFEQRGRSLLPETDESSYTDRGFLCQWDTMLNATDVDATQGPDPVLSDGATLDSDIKKWGPSSLKVGPGQARTASTIVQEVYLGKSWRWEFWVYFTGDSSNAVSIGNPTSVSIGKGGAFSAYNYNIACNEFVGGGGIGSVGQIPPLYTWLHVAVEQKAGQRMRLYDSHTGFVAEFQPGHPAPTFPPSAFSRVNVENGTTPMYLDSTQFRWFEEDEEGELYSVGGYSIPTGPFVPF